MRDSRQCIALILVFLITGCCKDAEIPFATKQLYSPHARERNDGALALARCGEKAAGAVPRLIQLLYDENVGVQSASAYALREIDTPPARRALERATTKSEN